MASSILDPLWQFLGYGSPAAAPVPARRVPVRLPTDDEDADKSIAMARSVDPKKVLAKRVQAAQDTNSGLSLADIVAGRTTPRASANEARLEGYKSAALMGGGDEIGGFGGAVGNWLGRNGGNSIAPVVSLLTGRGYNPDATFDPGSGDFSKDMERERSGEVKFRDQAYADRPLEYAEGYVPGFANSLVLPGGRAIKGESALIRARRLAAVGGAYGAASGALNAEPGDRSRGALEGGAIGAVATPAIGAVIDRVAPKILPKLGELIAGKTPEATVTPDGIQSPAEFVNRLNSEGAPFLDTPEANDYFTKNSADIKTELDRRIGSGANPADIDRRATEADQYYNGPQRRSTDVPVDPETPVTESAPTNPAAFDPAVAEAQRARLDQAGLPESTAAGKDDFLSNPEKGILNEVTLRDTDGLKALMAERGIDPETIGSGEPPVPPSEPPSGAAPEPQPEPQPEPIGTDAVVSKLTDALTHARGVLPEQQRMYSDARSARLGDVAKARAMSSGEGGFHSELGALKGDLPKKSFEDVKDQFSQPEIDHLFDVVKNHPQLNGYSSITARTGLAKLLEGQLPNKSQLDLLSRVFPPDFIKAALSNQGIGAKLTDAAGNLLNIPRSLMSSFDLSAPFRQGLFLVGRKEFWGGFKDMFKAFGSENAFNAIMDDIHSRPTAKLMDTAGLSIADPGHILSNREEQFMSNWAEKIPLVGRGVRASDRAYTGFLNKVRADTFDSIVQKSRDAGINFRDDPKALTDIASFVNNATGRGSLGKLQQAGPLLNGMFFSPRLIASRVTLLNPQYYAQLSPVVRKEAVKSLLSLGALATTVTGLAAAGGLDVETDPRSSDFAKIKAGNTRYDILGGFGQYLTLGARLATNQSKSLKGDVSTLGVGYGKPTRLDTLTNFATSKASPVASFVADYLRGKDYVGQPFDLKSEAGKMFVPLFLQDVQDAVRDNGVAKGAAMAAPGLFGVGVNTYDSVPPAPTTLKVGGQDVDMTPEMQGKYQDMVRSYLDVNLQKLKADGDWDKYDKYEKAQITAQIVKDGKKQAKEDLFAPAEAAPATPPATPTPASTGTPQPTASPNQPLFDGFSGLPTSIGRTPKGNEIVGGVANSDHVGGNAVDFVPPPGISMRELDAEARKYFTGMYVLNEGDHVHVRIPGLNGPLFGKRGAAK